MRRSPISISISVLQAIVATVHCVSSIADGSMIAIITIAAASFTPITRPLAPAVRVVAPATTAAIARTADPNMIGLAKVAAGANLFFFGAYGVGLLFKTNLLFKEIMKADKEYGTIGDISYAVAQYLGAVYLSQALRMVRALGIWLPTTIMKSDLLGVGTIQLFLCLTSLGRLLGVFGEPIEKNEVTLSLPVGQGLMAALAFAGARVA